MNPSTSNLLEKLRKILALTESPVEAEAQTAMETLQRLLLQHNLSMVDLEKRGARAPGVLEQGHDLGKAAFTWKLDLAETIAEHYFCHALVSRYQKTVSFVGRPDNVESLTMLYGWIIDQIKRISSDERRNNFIRTGEHIDPLRWQVNFGLGVVGRLGERLRQLRRADDTCTSLVIHHKSEISDYLEQQGWSRIDGRLTATQERYKKEREIERAADEKLKVENPEAYYEKYPWMRPLSAKEQAKADRKANRRTARRATRPMSDADWRKHKQGRSAEEAGGKSADRINLQPFLDRSKDSKGEIE